jgi:enoyl-[acyl-carrier protein] reductase I
VEEKSANVVLMSSLAEKTGLIVGVANKRSLSWGIAQAASAAGARLVLTYQGRFEEHVAELADTLSPRPLVLPLDVQNDGEIAAVFERIQQEYGGLDFLVHGVAFANREDISGAFTDTSRDGFRLAMDISAYSLIALARGARPLMQARGGGSIVTLSFLGSTRVFPNYNVMGVAKAALESSVRYLAADLGPLGIRVNAVSAGPIKTLASAGVGGFSNILGVVRERAPLRRTIDADEVADAAVFLLGPGGRGITGEILMVDSGYHAIGM